MIAAGGGQSGYFLDLARASALRSISASLPSSVRMSAASRLASFARGFIAAYAFMSLLISGGRDTAKAARNLTGAQPGCP